MNDARVDLSLEEFQELEKDRARLRESVRALENALNEDSELCALESLIGSGGYYDTRYYIAKDRDEVVKYLVNRWVDYIQETDDRKASLQSQVDSLEFQLQEAKSCISRTKHDCSKALNEVARLKDELERVQKKKWFR